MSSYINYRIGDIKTYLRLTSSEQRGMCASKLGSSESYLYRLHHYTFLLEPLVVLLSLLELREVNSPNILYGSNPALLELHFSRFEFSYALIIIDRRNREIFKNKIK